MKYMTSTEIRNMWYDYFSKHGHKKMESAPLIPIDDDSLLWINAGVTPLKKYFDGSKVPDCRRIVSIQKCIRTNDIENVGVTTRHQTFFEMMGNFSIGDYFKNEAIGFAYELLTSPEWFDIPKEKLYPLGIPTADTGVERISPEEAKRQLGLDPAKEYLLIAGGSMGAGALEEVVEILYRVRSLHKCKLIMVCGNNQQLYSRLQKRYADKIELVGYTDKMPLYLKAGSIFITKPGGLSSTEAAAARIPLIHICPIPGCETKNMQSQDREFVE